MTLPMMVPPKLRDRAATAEAVDRRAAGETDPLGGDAWRAASSTLLARTISEFCYEGLFEPLALGDGRYRVAMSEEVSYTFRADRGVYGSWFVDAESVRRTAHGSTVIADNVLVFVADTQRLLDLSGAMAAQFVRELSVTVTADMRLRGDAIPVADLADLSYAALEGYQTGHPWIIGDKARTGFSTADALRYGPEARKPTRLSWLAVRDDLARFAAVTGLSPRQLYTEELDAGVRVRFGSELVRRGVNPAGFWWLPVHPWQWDEEIQQFYGAELAAASIVPLGDGADMYLPHQSVRTFSNLATPNRRDVTVSLTVHDMTAWRGLPPTRTLAAPAVTSWLRGIVAEDSYLAEVARLIVLGEVASVTVEHPVLRRLAAAPYRYRELLGAIWREPLGSALEPGERARTLGALTHVDPWGRALVTELVHRSGLAPQEWLRRLFDVVLAPLLHLLYRYGATFSVRGENLVVVFDEHDVPLRLAITDFVDDLSLSVEDAAATTPEEVFGVLPHESPVELCQLLHTSLFVGQFRYLSYLMERHLSLPRLRFWRLVGQRIRDYQRRFDELDLRFARFDLFTPTVERRCPNRDRLREHGYRDHADRPRLAGHGTVPNPLCG